METIYQKQTVGMRVTSSTIYQKALKGMERVLYYVLIQSAYLCNTCAHKGDKEQ